MKWPAPSEFGLTWPIPAGTFMVIGLGLKQERLKRAPDSALAIDACLVIELANQGRKFTRHGEEGALRPYCRLMVGLAVLQEPPYALTHHWMQCGQTHAHE